MWTGVRIDNTFGKKLLNELPHDKTNKIACVPAQSDQSLRCPYEETLGS